MLRGGRDGSDVQLRKKTVVMTVLSAGIAGRNWVGRKASTNRGPLDAVYVIFSRVFCIMLFEIEAACHLPKRCVCTSDPNWA
jgi:hypothetical protein